MNDLNDLQRAFQQVENQQHELTELAQHIVLALGITPSADMAISSASIRISRDGSVYATANLRVGKYLSTRRLQREIDDAMDSK